MPKYLAQAKFTPQALEALRDAGAASRVAAGRDMAAGMGGALECYYYAFGEVDAFAILDLPDDESAAAASIAVNMAGAAQVTVTKLLTAEQVDVAFTRTVPYRAPGA